MTAIRIEQLRSAVRGPIIQPGDEEYESVRKVYNAMIDCRPQLVVQCADVADDSRGLNFCIRGAPSRR